MRLGVFFIIVGLSSAWAQENGDVNKFLFYKEKVQYYYDFDHDSSRLFIDSCFIYALKIDEQYYLGDAMQMRSRDFFMRSITDSALVYARKACEIFEYYPDSSAYYTAEYNIGNIYLALDEYMKAMIQFRKVLRIIDDNFDSFASVDGYKINMNRAYCYVSIGLIFDRLGDYENKLENLQKGYKISMRVDSRESDVLQAVTLGNIGQTYNELGEFETAEAYAIAGMEQKKKLGIESSIGYNYQVLARSAFGRKKYGLCLKYLQLSDKKFKEIQNSGELNNNELLRARCYFNQNKYDLALELLHELERSFDGPGAKSERIELNELLSEIYGSRKDFETSLKYLKIALELKDELVTHSYREAIDEFLVYFDEEESRINEKLNNYITLQEKEKLQMQVEAEKEKQAWIYSLFLVSSLCFILIIIVIARGNRRNKRINQELSYSIDEKQILFKEVHHRVKNNFQIISSLLNLQQGIEENPRSKKVLVDAQGRIQSMALVHEMLYRKNEVKKIDFSVYAEELVSSIVSSFRNAKTELTYTIESSHESFDLELAVPLGLILNEAVTNSVKYAFEGRSEGNIFIQLKPIDSKNYLLLIRDDGVGIPDEFINGARETLGIELINILCEQLGGAVQIQNQQGTEIRAVFNAVD